MLAQGNRQQTDVVYSKWEGVAGGGGVKLKVCRMVKIVLCNLLFAELSCVMCVVSPVCRYGTFSNSRLMSCVCTRAHKTLEALSRQKDDFPPGGSEVQPL